MGVASRLASGDTSGGKESGCGGLEFHGIPLYLDGTARTLLLFFGLAHSLVELAHHSRVLNELLLIAGPLSLCVMQGFLILENVLSLAVCSKEEPNRLPCSVSR